MKSILITLMTVFIANLTQAATIKTETTEKKFEGAKLVKSVTLRNDDNSESLMTVVSHGLRKKTVFGLIPVDVYVLQLLAAKPEKLIKTEEGFLASLKDAGPVQLHLTFLRSLSGEKISSSFKDGLAVNKIDIKNLSPALTKVLTEISAIKNFKDGENFSITINWSEDKATAYLTDASQKISVITDQKDFADQLLSIWFGNTSDSKLEDLKKVLIK